MTFGLYFKDLLENQLKQDNIYYPIHIENFVNQWNHLLWKYSNNNNLLILSNIIYKEIFCFLFFKKTIDYKLINKCFNKISYY